MAKFNLYSYQQAHQTILDLMPRIKSRLEGGHKLTLEITEESRSLDQNAMFHALIGQIAKQAEHFGSQWGTEEWKRLLVDQWARETGRQSTKVVPSLDGGAIVQLGLQTRKFTKAEASEFTEFVMAWGTQNGVVFNDVPKN